jgi:hypothetical protein
MPARDASWPLLGCGWPMIFGGVGASILNGQVLTKRTVTVTGRTIRAAGSSPSVSGTRHLPTG